LQTVCPDWSWSKILPISASQVTRITGMSHWHPGFVPTNKINLQVFYLFNVENFLMKKSHRKFKTHIMLPSRVNF
jgi:hypothetical protein